MTHDTRWDHGLRVAAEADGLLLAGWLVIDLDGTLITAHSDKQGAAPTFKKGYGFHPLAAWLANTPRAWRCCCGRATPATGWRYSIIVTNIPATGGIPGVPGSHHAQFIDVLHREHAVVEDQVRTNKAMGLRNLPSKTWVVNCGWVLAANIAADLSAWCRLLGLYDCDDLKDAEPGTLRYRLWALPARPPGPPRPATRPQDQPHLERCLPGLLAAAMRPAATRLTSHPVPATRKGGHPGAVGAGATPSTSGVTTTRRKPATQTRQPKPGIPRSVTTPARPLNHRG